MHPSVNFRSTKLACILKLQSSSLRTESLTKAEVQKIRSLVEGSWNCRARSGMGTAAQERLRTRDAPNGTVHARKDVSELPWRRAGQCVSERAGSSGRSGSSLDASIESALGTAHDGTDLTFPARILTTRWYAPECGAK